MSDISIEVSRVTVFEKDSLRGFASIKVGGAFFITGIRIIEGKNGLFISFPAQKNKDGEYQDVAFPASKAVREETQKLVLKAYIEKAGEDA